MIFVSKGNGQVEGSKGLILAELAYIIHHIAYDKDLNFKKEDIVDAVEHGLMTDEEVHEKAEQARKEMSKKIRAEIEKKLDCEHCDKKDSCSVTKKNEEIDSLMKVMDKLADKLSKDLADAVMGEDSDKKEEDSLDDVFKAIFKDLL